MQKKLILIILALVIVFPSMVYSLDDPEFRWATVSYEQRIFDPIFGIPTRYKIQALTEITNYDSGAVLINSSRGQWEMVNQGLWPSGSTGFVCDHFLGTDKNEFELSDYETTYTFSIAGTGQTKVVDVFSGTMIEDFGHPIPDLSDFPTVTWSSVAGAETYRVRIYKILGDRSDPDDPMVYESDKIYPPTTTHIFPGDLLPGDYSYVVGARIYAPPGSGGNWVNRSMYFAKLTVPEITIDGVYHFRDNRGVNSLGRSTGDRMAFGATSVVPSQGTEVIANQGETELPLFNSEGSNEFDRIMDYDPSLSGSWELTASNGANTATTDTPDRSNAELIPFVTNTSFRLIRTMDVPPSAGQLIISWEVPQLAIDRGASRVRLQVFDDETNLRVLDFPARSIPESRRMEFGLAPGLVEPPPHGYVLRILLEATDGGVLEGPPSIIISRSETYVNFMNLSFRRELEREVFLPATDEDPNPGDNLGPPQNFNISVLARNPVRIDPEIAIGYDYAIGEGNPLFESVTLPDIGDELFDIYLFNGSFYYLVKKDLQAGEPFYFDEPVAQFRVLGIGEEAGLDPSDPLAFVTELTFAGDGFFTGTMTPILYLSEIPATIDIKPDNLNAKSKGKYITCFIELSDGHFVENIDIDTIRLENSIPAKARPTKIGDYDQDGIPDLMMKFKRNKVIKSLGKVRRGDVIELQLTGELIDGKSIIGSDVITIVKKGNIDDDSDDDSDGDSDSENKGKKRKKKK